MEKTKEEITVNDEEVLTFTYRSGHYDMTLIVEGQRIRVVKAVLSVASPVFEAMFEDDFKEKQLAEIELPGKNYADFVELLSCLYPDKLKCVTKDNVYRLLPLIHEYQLVDTLHQQCDKLICEILRAVHVGNPSEIYRHLQLSNTYNLDMVKEKCIYLASELTTEQMAQGLSIYKPREEESSKILLLALKRHELDANDIQNIVKTSSFLQSSSGSGYVHCKRHVSEYIDKAYASTLLQALRLCYKYPENLNKKDTVIPKLYKQAPTGLQEDPEFDLLPDFAKQEWESYCFVKSKINKDT